MSNLLFKSQLQEYAQRACVSAPIYETTKEGPPHMPNFRASVIVNGVKYESTEAFRNRKNAEHAAAEVALQELGKGTDGAAIVTSPVYETGLCKNLLQEYAQKLSLPVPSYKCSKIGEGHEASFTAVVEIAGICYEGGPGNSKKGAEIKAARTALSAIHAQQALQALPEDPTIVPENPTIDPANPTIAHSDEFAGTWNSHPEVHAGMKRECPADQPPPRRKAKRNKKYKAFKKKKEIIQGSSDKDEILGESSSKASENGQQVAATENVIAANADEQHKNPQEETSMDEGSDTKQEEMPCSQETGRTIEFPDQLSVEVVAASVVAETQNKGGDIESNPVENDGKGKQEMNEDTDKYSVNKEGQKEMNEDTDKSSVDKGQKEMNEDTDKSSVDKEGQKEHESTNQQVLDPLKKCEHDEHESNQTLEESPEKEDLKRHETPENLNQIEVAPPSET